MVEDRDTDNPSKGDDQASSAVICPECGEENSAGAVICVGCHIALAGAGKPKRQSRRRTQSSESKRTLESAETRSRKRHPSVRARRQLDTRSDLAESVDDRSAKARSSKHAESEKKRRIRFRSVRRPVEDDVILWEGKLSKTQRLRQWIPASFLEWGRRAVKKADARVILATGVAVALIAALSVGFSLRPKQRQDTAQGLGLAFETSERWQDVTGSREWLGYFVVASKIVNLGAGPSLVLFKDKTGLAILSRVPATDTVPAEAASSDTEDLGLVYSLSSDTRLYGREEVELFGAPAIGFIAERWVASEYYNEEVIVAPLGDRVVYVVFTAPQAQWESESREIWKILQSARAVPN